MTLLDSPQRLAAAKRKEMELTPRALANLSLEERAAHASLRAALRGLGGPDLRALPVIDVTDPEEHAKPRRKHGVLTPDSASGVATPGTDDQTAGARSRDGDLAARTLFADSADLLAYEERSPEPPPPSPPKKKQVPTLRGVLEDTMDTEPPGEWRESPDGRGGKSGGFSFPQPEAPPPMFETLPPKMNETRFRDTGAEAREEIERARQAAIRLGAQALLEWDAIAETGLYTEGGHLA